MKYSGIYLIKSKVDERVYIGSAFDFKRRKREHFNKLKNSKHPNKKLQSFYNKYGKDSLEFSIILYSNKDYLLIHEQGYINYYSNIIGLDRMFNVAKTAECPMFGRKHTDESLSKISKASKGRVVSDETKKKISEAHKGRIISEEHRRRLSEAAKLRFRTKEEREKISGRKNKRSKAVLQYTIENKLMAEYGSGLEAQRITGIKQQNISLCCLGKSKTAGGFIWEYK